MLMPSIADGSPIRTGFNLPSLPIKIPQQISILLYMHTTSTSLPSPASKHRTNPSRPMNLPNLVTRAKNHTENHETAHTEPKDIPIPADWRQKGDVAAWVQVAIAVLPWVHWLLVGVVGSWQWQGHGEVCGVSRCLSLVDVVFSWVVVDGMTVWFLRL